MYSRILSRRQMTVWCITLSGALALCIGLHGLLGWGRTQLDTGAALAADTLRLHIRAASDTTADQTDKLAVRDAVLAYLDTACPAADQPAALRWAAAHLSELQRVARTVLAGRGSFAPVRVYLVEMYFGTTRYAASALPAGRYQALRIDLGGNARHGKNWWCVMFPALCLPAVTNTDEVLSLAAENGVISTEELELMQDPENYEVKFYFAEVIKKLCEKLNKA